MAQGIETLFGRTEKNIDSLLRVAGYNNREVVYDRTTETYTSRSIWYYKGDITLVVDFWNGKVETIHKMAHFKTSNEICWKGRTITLWRGIESSFCHTRASENQPNEKVG